MKVDLIKSGQVSWFLFRLLPWNSLWLVPRIPLRCMPGYGAVCWGSLDEAQRNPGFNG